MQYETLGRNHRFLMEPVRLPGVTNFPSFAANHNFSDTYLIPDVERSFQFPRQFHNFNTATTKGISVEILYIFKFLYIHSSVFLDARR